jgi:hypothetical protein
MNADKHRYNKLLFPGTGVRFRQASTLRFNGNNPRSSADRFLNMSEAKNTKFVTITVECRELKADG